MTVSAVVFDLDYTLAVPRRDRSELLAEAMDAVDAPRFSREEYLDAHGRNLTTENRAPIFEDLLDADTDVPPEDAAAAYREAIADALEPVDGAEDLVADLRESYRVGLLTNGPIVAQRDKLETLGWTELFDAVVVSGELPAGKPDERAFRTVLAELDAPVDEAAFVGDHPEADVEGATSAGLAAVQVLYEGGPEPSDRAAAVVRRDELRRRLPEVLASL